MSTARLSGKIEGEATFKQLAEFIDITEEDCSLCKVHEAAYTLLSDGISCPFCGQFHKEYSENWFSEDLTPDTVVGETNGSDTEQKIRKWIVLQCQSCNEHFALVPTKIIYNANHDVYYTGGKDYTPDMFEKAVEDIWKEAEANIKKSIEQYTTRIKAGEELDPSYPATWCKRDVTASIAKYLYEHGFKK